MQKNIDRLLKKGFQLRLWDDRYGLGVWAAMGRQFGTTFIDVCELTDSADIEAAGFNEYISNSGSWLPFETGNTAIEAIAALEKKLKALPDEQLSSDSVWANKYDEALELLLDFADGTYGISNKIDSGDLPEKPEL